MTTFIFSIIFGAFNVCLDNYLYIVLLILADSVLRTSVFLKGFDGLMERQSGFCVCFGFCCAAERTK